eukprot:scaffold34395_cov31-Tisochrysis_lutea.AAC.3
MSTTSTYLRAIRAAFRSTASLAALGISCMANMMVTTSYEKGSPAGDRCSRKLGSLARNGRAGGMGGAKGNKR